MEVRYLKFRYVRCLRFCTSLLFGGKMIRFEILVYFCKFLLISIHYTRLLRTKGLLDPLGAVFWQEKSHHFIQNLPLGHCKTAFVLYDTSRKINFIFFFFFTYSTRYLRLKRIYKWYILFYRQQLFSIITVVVKRFNWQQLFNIITVVVE